MSEQTLDVARIPAGADADEWQVDDGKPFRILYARRRQLPGNVTVSATALQHSDGRIDNGDVWEPPQVYVDHPDRGFTIAEARALAAALLEVADELDGWTGQPTRKPAPQCACDATDLDLFRELLYLVDGKQLDAQDKLALIGVLENSFAS